MRRVAWHRLRRCSRVNPLLRGGARQETNPEPCAVNVGAGLPAKQATRCMAPAAPVFAGEPVPTGARAKKPTPRKPCAVNVGAGLPAKQATQHPMPQ